jgi:hypothetical protein
MTWESNTLPHEVKAAHMRVIDVLLACAAVLAITYNYVVLPLITFHYLLLHSFFACNSM